MNNWKLYHFIVVIAVVAVAGAAGYFGGILLSNPQLSQDQYEEMVASFIEKQTGQKPYRVETIAGPESDFGDLAGNVVDSAGSNRYFIVKMSDEIDLRGSLAEGGPEDIYPEHGVIEGVYSVIAGPDGVDVLEVRY